MHLDEKIAAFQKDATEALSAIGKKYGFVVAIGNIKYNGHDTGYITNKVTTETDDERELFEKYCEQYGFRKEDYLRELTYMCRKYRLFGFVLKKVKNTCRLYCVDNGEVVRLSPAIVKECFK